MFLFTTPAPTASDKPATGPAPGATPVVDAIRTGSERTGTDFGYLLSTAKRESSLDPEARASTSSATGLFQFIEQTWLGIVKGTGATHGLGPYAQAINETRSGRYEVSDPAMKAQILALRNDPKIAAVMAGEFTRRNAGQLQAALGRQPSDGELYAAHFMGAGGAADLIRAAKSQPASRAADLFPDVAASNRSIFFDKATGQARSVSEVHALLTSGQGKLAVPAIPQLGSDPTTWLGTRQQEPPPLAAAYAEGGPAMFGLFRTEGARGPINQTVQRLWSKPLQSDTAAPRFFPRGEATASTAPAAAIAVAPATASGTPASARPADVPLPIPRPADLSGAAQPRTAHTPAGQGGGARVASARGKPLDLLSFTDKPGGRS